MSLVENRGLGEGLWEMPSSAQSLGRAEAAKLRGRWGGGTPEEQSRLCPLVSHGLKPNQTTAQARSASNQSWCPSQMPPSFLRPPCQSHSLQDPRNSGVWNLRFLFLQTQKSGPPTLSPQDPEQGPHPSSPLEPEITASGWCWASPSGGQRSLACDSHTS